MVGGAGGRALFSAGRLPALVALLPVPAGAGMPQITLAIKLLSLVQPGILLALAVLAGVVLAHRVGLSSPAAEAAASGSRGL